MGLRALRARLPERAQLLELPRQVLARRRAELVQLAAEEAVRAGVVGHEGERVALLLQRLQRERILGLGLVDRGLGVQVDVLLLDDAVLEEVVVVAVQHVRDIPARRPLRGSCRPRRIRGGYRPPPESSRS